MDMNTTGVWIAGYAAIISTLALVWNIVDAILQYRSRIVVRATIRASFEAIPGIGVTSDTRFLLSVEIVNVSKTKKYIRKPLLKTPNKIDKCNMFQWVSLNDRTNYPIELEQGQSHTADMELGDNLVQLLNRCNRRGKVRIVVKDTIGKQYLSNKVKVKVILENCGVKGLV